MTRVNAMEPLERTVTVRDRHFLLRVETSEEPGDYRKYEDLLEEIWRFAEDHMSSARNMMCENVWHEGASLFIGAFAESPGGGFAVDASGLVGFCYGFVGVADKEIGFRDVANLRFYSQFAGVRQPFQSYGLGILIKEFQRETVLGLMGVSTIICTYDPLTGVNANRNVRHFGMEVLEYRVDKYGEYGGLLNRADVPTDRFLMSWDLRRTFGAHRRPSGPGHGASPGRAESSISRSWKGSTRRPRGRSCSSASRSISTGCSRKRTWKRRRSGASPSTGGWPRGRFSGPSLAGATGSSISSRPVRARPPTTTFSLGPPAETRAV